MALGRSSRGHSYQHKRCVLSVYTSLVKNHLDPNYSGVWHAEPGRKAVERAFEICTRSLQDKGYLQKGTNKPTKKGRERSAEMAETEDVEAFLADYERMLEGARSGKPWVPLEARRAKKVKHKPTAAQMAARRAIDKALRKHKGSASIGDYVRFASFAPSGSLNREARADLVTLRRAMDNVFSSNTAYGDWNADTPSSGHCLIASMTVQDLFGGDILVSVVKGVPHYWNRLDGYEADLTGDQFGQPRVQVRKQVRDGVRFQRQPREHLGQPFNRKLMRLYYRFLDDLTAELENLGCARWTGVLEEVKALG